MKLATDIPARKTGGITVTAPASGDTPAVKYAFVAGVDGVLTCEVGPDSHAVFLLDTGNFYPAEEHDMDASLAAIRAVEGQQVVTEEGDDAHESKEQAAAPDTPAKEVPAKPAIAKTAKKK